MVTTFSSMTLFLAHYRRKSSVGSMMSHRSCPLIWPLSLKKLKALVSKLRIEPNVSVSPISVHMRLVG